MSYFSNFINFNIGFQLGNCLGNLLSMPFCSMTMPWNNWSFPSVFNYPTLNNFGCMNYSFNDSLWCNNFYTPTYTLPPITLNTPTFNYYDININSSCSNYDTFTPTSNKRTKYTGVLADYNPQRGKELANIAKRRAIKINTKGDCAMRVQEDIGEWKKKTRTKGDAYTLIDTLSRDPDFKRIDPNSIDFKHPPEGCVFVYDKGVAGSNPKFGHAFITLSDGKGASDHIQNNIKETPPTAVFIPV